MKTLKKSHLWLLSILSGVLLAAAWPTEGFTPLIFLALIPLFLVEDYVLERQKSIDAGEGKKQKYHIFGYSYLTFLIWNIMTTWWIWFSTPAACLAFAANALLMALTFTLFHYSCRHFFKKGMRWSVLFIFWIGFEYFHHNWDISWPWLTLGNVFATKPQWVQWYEYTGVLGGSLWVLSVNVALFYFIKRFIYEHRKSKSVETQGQTAVGHNIPTSRKPLVTGCLLILIPLTFSMIRFYTYQEKGEKVEVVVVQPNIDPYNEQFNLSPVEAVDRMISLAKPQLTSQTRFIVTPESMIQENVWENALDHSPSIQRIREFLQRYPQTWLIAGISTLTQVKPEDSLEAGVRKFRKVTDPNHRFYRIHNTVMSIGGSQKDIPLRHKSKLTPAVEIMPFADKLRFIERLSVNMGGNTGTLGVDKEPGIFLYNPQGGCRMIGRGLEERYRSDLDLPSNFNQNTSVSNEIGVADMICYESVFGDYVAQTVRLGANLIFVSTNDGWWQDTPGHRQHAAYARLRAIENRRSIARSANTGISCFINQKGQVSQATAYWEPDCIRQEISLNRKNTFYTQYGDILGRCCLPLSLFFLLLTFVYRIFPQAWKDYRSCKDEP